MRLHDGEDARQLARDGIEVWRPIRGCDSYWISNLGRLASQKRGRKVPTILDGYASGDGYRGCALYMGTYTQTTLVHRLVLAVFDGDPPTEAHTDGCHLNGDKQDNRLCNLMWGTRSENQAHRWQTPERAPPLVQRPETERTRTALDLDARLVLLGLRWHTDRKVTIADLADLWNCSTTVASGVVHGETWTHLDRPIAARKQKLSPAVRAQIRQRVLAGASREEVNVDLGLNLTHQDFYYYKVNKR